MKKNFFLFFFFLLISAIAFSAKPVLSASVTQPVYPGTSKPYLTIVSGSGKISYVSSTLSDPTDPAVFYGIYFTITNSPTTISLTSNKTSVLPNANISFVESGGIYTLKITPIAVGYATVSIIASNIDGSSSTYKVTYAVSAASAHPDKTIWPANMADASGATSIDDNYMFVCDDETNILRLHSRKNSGIDVYNIDITSSIGATEEGDLEGSSLSVKYNTGKRIYWIGSLGNSKSGNSKPDRDRVIATDINGNGATSTLSVKSYSKKFRTALISWGNSQSWDFTTSASTSLAMIPKRIDGFNVEGLTVTHGGDTGYVGFRAPCVPIKGVAPNSSNRKYAVIAPVANFETIMNGGNSEVLTMPLVADPILFDLEGLGIRSIERVGTNLYVIVAGLFTGGGAPAVYLWDGKVPANPGVNPITTSSSYSKLTKLNLPGLDQLAQISSNGDADGHPEALVAEQVGSVLFIHLICDNGTVDYYADGTEAKLLTQLPQRKFRYDNFAYDLTSYTTNCSNGVIKFTANNTPGNTYQWQINTGNGYTNISNNALYAGATTDTLKLINAPTAMYGYLYRCVITNNSNITYSSENMLQFKGYWLGTVSNAWETAANWGCGILPDANTDVIINIGTPILSSNTSVRSVTVNPNASLKINSPNKLTILH